MQSDFKNFDWQGLIKLPVQKTAADRAERKKIWSAMDMNGNGYISLAEFDRGIRDVLGLPQIFSQKKSLSELLMQLKIKLKEKQNSQEIMLNGLNSDIF